MFNSNILLFPFRKYQFTSFLDVFRYCSFLNSNNGYGLLQSTLSGCFSALGFTLSLLLFSCIREKLELSNMPKWMEGFPGALIAAGLMAVSFMGFSGLIG